MTRITLFNSPLFLGFDHFERLVDRASKITNEGYPPYNIEQVGENGLRITLAAAGFSSESLEVSIEDNQLVIRGCHVENGNRVYLHRGIATRQFQRTFILAEGIEVVGASFENGLLNIELIRPETTVKARRIPIKTSIPSLACSQLLNSKLKETDFLHKSLSVKEKCKIDLPDSN
ncbi:MAG: Hsp20 family protein [Holosporales bacterium]|jgi:HSP20 family molecular chaperone IbpA|nr:Hsp20 family protein [Holosporales bacterium]